ncbi:L-ascorbate peroxidase, partial [Haematococcus lacustris]
VARDLLDPVKERFPWISYADLWTLAGCVAVEEMGGPWTNAPTTFSNLYFQELLNRHWRKKSWSGPLQYEDKESGKLMMLPTDMALIQDRAFKKWTQLYAQDEQRFFDDFAVAFQKLLELGVNFPVDGPLAA